MSNTQIIINNNPVMVNALYYLSNNNYYAIYTSGETDENGFIILHIVKVFQEVVNTNNGPQPTGYLIGTTIVNDDEYNLVKQDISHIIDEKQNNLESTVHFLDVSAISQLKIRDTKIFRLKKSVYDKVFGNESITINTDTNSGNVNTGDFEQMYYQEVEKNKQLQVEIDNLNNKLENIKNMLQG